ncbi:MAG: thioesterase family protein [Anaerolineae bacterium]
MTEHTLTAGLQAELTLTVAPEHLASRWGSGGVDVFATPQMIGLMEQAAVRAVDHLLPPGFCSVGTRLDVRHLAATLPGHTVTARATLEEIDGRRLVFRVTAEDAAGTIGEGTHERMIVALERFIMRAEARGRSGL